MNQMPRVLVFLQEDYENQVIYEEVIESFLGIGYSEAFRKDSTDSSKNYTVLELEP